MKYIAIFLMLSTCVYGIDKLKEDKLETTPIKCLEDSDCMVFCSWLCHTPRVGRCDMNRCLCRALPQQREGLDYTKEEVKEGSLEVRCAQTWED